MKSVIHRAGDRGVAEHGWLHSRFSFSFAEWYDPLKMGFGVLRVLNDDIIDPCSGFGKHPHSDMEIITIVTEGVVSHEDSMGNKYEVPAGDVQVMSAGTGVVHAEFNRGDSTLALFQIWITPHTEGLLPRYDQKSFGKIKEKNKFELLVSPNLANSRDSENLLDWGIVALRINQEAYVYRAVIDGGTTIEHALKNPKHGAYIFVVTGEIEVAGSLLSPRDAIGVWDIEKISIVARASSEILFFEVPMNKKGFP